jgi:RNA polymerase sigma-70 factor, ECF subfamily
LNENNINIDSDDFDLIKSFKKGNKNAFNLIVLRYQKKIYWVIRKMVIDHDDADDLTQDVFIKIYNTINDFRGDSKFFTYIYKIAVNFSLNHIKSKKILISRKADFETEVYKLKSEDKSSDEVFETENNQKLIEKAILSLPGQQRAVFNLRFYDNLSYEEISDILNTSVGGLKANYFHAIKKIENFIKKEKINL